MDNSENDNLDANVTRRVHAKLEPCEARLGDVLVDPERWAFRSAAEYNDNQIKELAEEIKLAGLLTPLVVSPSSDGKYELRDGFRRWHAMQYLVNQNANGWSLDRKIPLQALPAEPNEAEDLLRVGALNVQRRAWGDTALVRYCKAVADAGVSTAELARVIGRSQKHTERYLKLAACSWMIEHVEQNHVGLTAAFNLVELLNDKNDAALKNQIETWLQLTKAEIAEENQSRLDAEKTELTGKQLWPAKRLKAEVLGRWKRGLTTGDWSRKPAGKVRTFVEEDKLRISGVNMDLHKIDLSKLVTIYGSLVTTIHDLEPVLRTRKAQHDIAQPQQDSNPDVSRRIAEMGLGEFLHLAQPETDGPVDVEFGTGDPALEEDYSDTFELPGDDSLGGGENSDFDDDLGADFDEHEDNESENASENDPGREN